MALAARRTQMRDAQDARADTRSAFIGSQVFCAPDFREGFYLTAQGRIGLESGEMDRDIAFNDSFNGHRRSTEGRWTCRGCHAGLRQGLERKQRVGVRHVS